METDIGLDGLLTELVKFRPDQIEHVGLALLTHAQETLLDSGAQIDKKVYARYTTLCNETNPTAKRRHATILESYLQNHDLSAFEHEFGCALIEGLRLFFHEGLERSRNRLLDICHLAANSVESFHDCVDNPVLPGQEHDWQLAYLDSLLDPPAPPDGSRSRISVLAS